MPRETVAGETAAGETAAGETALRDAVSGEAVVGARQTSRTFPALSKADLGRLRWRCRRGMRELDVLLERYVDEQFRDASAADQEAFRQLLDTQDTVIYAYCLGHKLPPPPLLGVIERITANPAVGR